MAIRVGVLRGGLSNEHEVSLRTGKNILANLPPAGIIPARISEFQKEQGTRERFTFLKPILSRA